MTVNEYKEEAGRVRPKLLIIARRYMGGEDEAEDVVQDILLKLWQICDTLRLPIDPLACVLVRNRCIDLLRKHRRTVEIGEEVVDCVEQEDDRVERMMNIIDTLPTLQQTVLKLRHLEGMEIKDIAELICSTEVAVRKTLSRARMSVRQHF